MENIEYLRPALRTMQLNTLAGAVPVQHQAARWGAGYQGLALMFRFFSSNWLWLKWHHLRKCIQLYAASSSDKKKKASYYFFQSVKTFIWWKSAARMLILNLYSDFMSDCWTVAWWDWCKLCFLAAEDIRFRQQPDWWKESEGQIWAKLGHRTPRPHRGEEQLESQTSGECYTMWANSVPKCSCLTWN